MTSGTLDWDESGTLTRVLPGSYAYAIRTDPLWILILTAKQGHEGPVEEMRIKTVSGAEYGPSDIEVLARRSDRKWG